MDDPLCTLLRKYARVFSDRKRDADAQAVLELEMLTNQAPDVLGPLEFKKFAIAHCAFTSASIPIHPT